MDLMEKECFANLQVLLTTEQSAQKEVLDIRNRLIKRLFVLILLCDAADRNQALFSRVSGLRYNTIGISLMQAVLQVGDFSLECMFGYDHRFDTISDICHRVCREDFLLVEG